MKLLEAVQNVIPQRSGFIDDAHLKLLYPQLETKTREEVTYRRNGRSIDRITEFDLNTGSKIKTTHYDYFNDKKIRSIDEYDLKTGKKLRTINYVLYKSVDEYDLKTGKKVRTINYSVKDETKISSIQEYDIETGKIITISIYKRDGKTISIVKRIDPKTDKVTNWINDKVEVIERNDKIFTRNYDNMKFDDEEKSENIANLIDNLYRKEIKFENI